MMSPRFFGFQNKASISWVILPDGVTVEDRTLLFHGQLISAIQIHPFQGWITMARHEKYALNIAHSTLLIDPLNTASCILRILNITRWTSRDEHYTLIIANWTLHVDHCQLNVTRWSLPIECYTLIIAHWTWHGDHCQLNILTHWMLRVALRTEIARWTSGVEYLAWTWLKRWDGRLGWVVDTTGRLLGDGALILPSILHTAFCRRSQKLAFLQPGLSTAALFWTKLKCGFEMKLKKNIFRDESEIYGNLNFWDESEMRKSNAETILKSENMNLSDESENLHFWNESEIWTSGVPSETSGVFPRRIGNQKI